MTDYGRCVDALFLLLTAVATGLHSYALASPNWWVVEEETNTGQVVEEHFGIWFTRICMNLTSCTNSGSNKSGNRGTNFFSQEIETVMEVFFFYFDIDNFFFKYLRK